MINRDQKSPTTDHDHDMVVFVASLSQCHLSAGLFETIWQAIGVKGRDKTWERATNQLPPDSSTKESELQLVMDAASAASDAQRTFIMIGFLVS